MIVDWSAAGTPKTGRDSIWICAVGRDGAEQLLENPPTRHAAKATLRQVLADCMRRGERVLAGFDFPFGYPAGFAAGLGLAGSPPWRAVWDEIASLLADDERNRNNRFEVGARFNQRVSGGRFPFWGCPASAAGPFLGATHHHGHDGNGLAEKRLIDTWMIGAQPCWKLAYTGSVGSQVLDRDPGRPRVARRSRMGRPGPHLAVRDRVRAPIARRGADRVRRGLAVMVAGPAGTRTAERQGAGPNRGRHLCASKTEPANWRAGWPDPLT